MTKNEKTEENNSEKKTMMLGDDTIAIIRELLQLSILTGTNIVDHLRAVVVEVDQESGKIVPTEEYVNAYNSMVEALEKKAAESVQQSEMSLKKKVADEKNKMDGLHIKESAQDDNLN